MDRTDTPDDETLIKDIARQAVAKVGTMLPGRILSYDRATQTCTVRPLIRRSRRDPVTGARISYLPEPVSNVPVWFPGGSAGGLTYDLAAGDDCLIFMAERSLDEWKGTGRDDNTPADFMRRHDLTDAIVFPGVRPIVDPLPATAYASGAVVLRGGDVRLGDSTATDFVALASLVLAELQHLAAQFNAHTHLYAPGPGTPVPTATPIPTATPATSVAADKVKAT